jgi:hypothetical protein
MALLADCMLISDWYPTGMNVGFKRRVRKGDRFSIAVRECEKGPVPTPRLHAMDIRGKSETMKRLGETILVISAFFTAAYLNFRYPEVPLGQFP